MNSEYDRTVPKAALASFFTYKELGQIGIKPEGAKKHLDSLQGIWMELKNSELTVHDMIKLRLNKKIPKTENELALIEEKEKGGKTLEGAEI